MSIYDGDVVDFKDVDFLVPPLVKNGNGIARQDNSLFIVTQCSSAMCVNKAGRPSHQWSDSAWHCRGCGLRISVPPSATTGNVMTIGTSRSATDIALWVSIWLRVPFEDVAVKVIA